MIKTTLAALALALLPGLAIAQGCHHDTSDQSASSCMDGMVWDTEKGTCVAKPSS